MSLIYRCVKLDFACASWLQWVQRNRTEASGAQSSCRLSRATNTDCARALVWWWYGGFPNPLEEERTSPYGEGYHLCLETTSSVSQFCFPGELKGGALLLACERCETRLPLEVWVGPWALGHGSSDFSVLRTVFLLIWLMFDYFLPLRKG